MNRNLKAMLFMANIVAIVHGALIISEIAEGLCKQYSNFLVTHTLPPRLERHQNPHVLPQSRIKWTSCDLGSCIPFMIAKHENLNIAKSQIRNNQRIQPQLSVIVELRSEPDCLGHEISSLIPIMCDHGAANARIVTKFLKNYTAQAQAGVVNILESKRRSLGFVFEPLWITNKIVVTGSDVATVKQMLGYHKDVRAVRLEEVVEIERPHQETSRSNNVSAAYPPHWFWGQIQLNVPEIHSAGINGSGIVVGGIDSGVDYTHPALSDNFRGEYGWFDPYFADPFPSDENGHGTHTMGTVVGEPPFGVAPGATWIACRSCLKYACAESATIKCMQWILCPTRSNGTEPNCSKKPHVVNNSWGGPEYGTNGSQPDHKYEGIIRCWRQAGIIPVFSAGNRGPSCSGLSYPGISNQVMGVGMLSGYSTVPHVHVNSSRGPPGPYWNGTIKPDFVAPGDEIFSTWPDGGTKWRTGTSHAAPHVTGTIALMLQVNPTLKFYNVRDALIASARPTQVFYRQSCGGISEDGLPNNQAGYGSINSYKAVFGTWPQFNSTS